jgi:hypothetical protein
MKLETAEGEIDSLVSRVRDALIAKGRLTPEGAVRIDEAMRNDGIGFGDAAITLGLINEQELVDATRKARQLPPNSPEGIFEGALNRMSFNRNMPVKYVGMVKAGPELTLLRDPDDTYSEQIRALRTELLLLNNASRNGNMIVILSP